MENKKILIAGAVLAAIAWIATFCICAPQKNVPETKFVTPPHVLESLGILPEQRIYAETAATDLHGNAENFENFSAENPPSSGEIVVPESVPENNNFVVPAEPNSAPAEGKIVVPAQKFSAPVLAKKIPKAPRAAISSFKNVGEICVDSEGKFLTGTNIQAPCPPASTVKLVTLFVVFDAISRGKISLQSEIFASKKAAGTGGTQLYLVAGERAKIEDLLYGLMLQSANDAAVALAEGIYGSVPAFVEEMNKVARELGMTRSKFFSPHGLPPSKADLKAGIQVDITTAEDMAKLAVALLKRFPDETFKFCSTITKSFPANEMRKTPMPMKNHNRLLESFDGCDGLKTGWTNAGAAIVTTASRGNQRVIAVVLGGLVKNKNGEIDPKTSQRERDQRAATLMYSGLQKLDVMKYEATPFPKN